MTPRRIHRYLLDDVLTTLAQVEPSIAEQMGGMSGYDYLKQPKANTYRRAGKWLLREDYLERLIKTPRLRQGDTFIPGFPCGRKLIFDLWIIRWLGKRYIIEATPQAILVKNSLRTFYLEDGLNPRWAFTAKIAIGDARDLNSMRTDIQVRGKFTQLGLTGFPKILSSELENNPSFFCEEVIPGRIPHPIKDGEVLCKQIVPQMGGIYEKYGVNFKQVRDAFDIELMAQDLAFAMESIQWSAQWMDKSAFLGVVKKLIHSEKLMPCSITHGDLGKGNILITPDDKTYIIDWEFSSEMPVIYDLFRLTASVPTVQATQAIHNLLATIIDGHKADKVLCTQEQLFIANLHEISRYVSILKRAQKQSSQRKLKARLMTQLDLANSFLSEFKSSPMS